MTTKRAGPNPIVHISTARRTGRSAMVLTEPPCEVVPMLASEVPERNRALLVEADIRADMNAGDPMGWALRKANYVIETARSVFREQEHLDSVVGYAVEAVRDYGEPRGAELLRKAFRLHGSSDVVRIGISEAAARMGGPDDFDIILKCLEKGRDAPEPHLRALSDFADRHPGKAGAIHEALRGIVDPGEAVQDSIRSFSRRG